MDARRWWVPAFFFLLLVVTSCAQPIEPTLDVTQSASTLVVRPASGGGGASSSMQLTVKRHYPQGDVEDISGSALYTIEKGIGNVTARGVVTATSDAYPLVIRVADPSSSAIALTSVQVVAAQIIAIDLSPSPAVALSRGEARLFSATARYNSGDVVDVTGSVVWTSSDERVALAGNDPGDKGLVRAVGSGTTTIAATDATTQVQGRSSLFVTPDGVTLLSILVSPNPTTVGAGKTAQLRADGVYSDGSTKDLTQGVTWSTSRADVAAVDTHGLAGGVAVGDATVTAAAPDPGSGIKGSAAVKVVP